VAWASCAEEVPIERAEPPQPKPRVEEEGKHQVDKDVGHQAKEKEVEVKRQAKEKEDEVKRPAKEKAAHSVP
jgi:hypothetical protein